MAIILRDHGKTKATPWQWRGESFMAIGMQDPVLGPPAMQYLHTMIRNCPEPMEVAEAGHFVQEWGAPIAAAALLDTMLVSTATTRISALSI